MPVVLLNQPCRQPDFPFVRSGLWRIFRIALQDSRFAFHSSCIASYAQVQRWRHSRTGVIFCICIHLFEMGQNFLLNPCVSQFFFWFVPLAWKETCSDTLELGLDQELCFQKDGPLWIAEWSPPTITLFSGTFKFGPDLAGCPGSSYWVVVFVWIRFLKRRCRGSLCPKFVCPFFDLPISLIFSIKSSRNKLYNKFLHVEISPHWLISSGSI